MSEPRKAAPRSPGSEGPLPSSASGPGVSEADRRADLVVVANRLPVDKVTDPDGDSEWRRSPGGLVTALEPVMRRADGAWVGWPGQPDIEVEPFEFEGTHLVPVSLSADEVENYYEGMSNDTIWPLYHDVISPPRYRRVWWDAYVKVNRRFAEHAFQSARRIEPAGLSGLLDTINHCVGFFAEADDITEPNFLWEASQRESAPDATLCLKITVAAQVMHNFDQVMA